MTRIFKLTSFSLSKRMSVATKNKYGTYAWIFTLHFHFPIRTKAISHQKTKFFLLHAINFYFISLKCFSSLLTIRIKMKEEEKNWGSVTHTMRWNITRVSCFLFRFSTFNIANIAIVWYYDNDNNHRHCRRHLVILNLSRCVCMTKSCE